MNPLKITSIRFTNAINCKFLPSGDEESEPYPAHSTSSPFTPPLTPVDEEKPVASLLFSGITYLGSSSVDAPISEVEANRKMHVLREQSEGTEPIPIILSVPLTNYGSVVLKDPGTDQPMATHPIKLILFCARGNAEVLLDCFCLNVKNRRSGLYQCHVFRCDSADSVSVCVCGGGGGGEGGRAGGQVVQVFVLLIHGS